MLRKLSLLAYCWRQTGLINKTGGKVATGREEIQSRSEKCHDTVKVLKFTNDLDFTNMIRRCENVLKPLDPCPVGRNS